MKFFQKLQLLKSKNSQLTLDILTNIIFYVMVVLFYLSGITLILMITSHDTIINLPIIKDRFYGLASIVLVRQVPSLVLGFALLICGRAIANRNARAFYPTLVFLTLAVIYTIFFYRSSAPTVFLILLELLLIISRSHLYRKQLIISHEDSIIDGLIWVFLIISYFVLGFVNLVDKDHIPPVSYENHFSVPSFHWWFVGLVTLLAIALSTTFFLFYLRKGRHDIGEIFEENRFKALLAMGDHHYTGLAFLKDKRIWYYQKDGQDQMALQFRVQRDKLLIMGDFFGNRDYFNQALDAFMKEADAHNFHPVFYEVSESEVMAIHDYGFEFFKLGEEGHVDPVSFSLSGKKKQNLRSVMNQTSKSGYTFEILEPPYSSSVMEALQVVSDEWLNGRQEMGFSLGFFDPYYLNHSKIALLKSNNGTVVAFATVEKSHSENSLSIDLMRYINEAPKGVMDVLFIHLIQYAKEENISTFNMGMCPLSNVGKNRFSFFNEKLGHLLYQFGSHIYSFDGLRHYKEKFASDWRPYYIAYPKQCHFLCVTMALLLVSYQSE